MPEQTLNLPGMTVPAARDERLFYDEKVTMNRVRARYVRITFAESAALFQCRIYG